MQIKEHVKQVLESNVMARNDDLFCYLRVLVNMWKIEPEHFIPVYNLLKQCPWFETVRRSRQYIQAEHPELWPTDLVKKKRRKKAELMRDWKGDIDKVNEYY